MQLRKGSYLILTPGKSQALDVSTMSRIEKYPSNDPLVSVTGEPEAGVAPANKIRRQAYRHPCPEIPKLIIARKGGIGGVARSKGGGLTETSRGVGGTPSGGANKMTGSLSLAKSKFR
jgi:hypothetical protein